MKKLLPLVRLLSIVVFSLLGTNLVGQAATATWALTANVNSVVTGNITATSATRTGVTTLGTPFNATGWGMFGWPDINQINLTKYYEFTVSPTAGNTLNVTGLSFDGRYFGSTYCNSQVFYSTNNFTTSTQVLPQTQFTNNIAQTINLTTLNIPVAAAGTLKVRIYFYFADPTTSTSNTRVRNFKITGTTTSAVPCTGTPAPGNTLASINPVTGGTSTVLSLQNTTSGTGVTYQWQSASSLTGIYSDIGAATGSIYTVTPTAKTFYRCVVTCSGSSGTSTPVEVNLKYCDSAGNMSYDTGITGVLFNTISNLNQTPSKIAAYTNNSGISTTVTAGSSYPLSVYENTDGDYPVYAKVWIDWNQNFIFDAAESYELGFARNVVNGITDLSPLNITVPTGAKLGNTRMRISARFSASATSCENGFDGEIEDYTVNVVAPFVCPSFAANISIGGATDPGTAYPTLTNAIADFSKCSINQATTLSLIADYNSAGETFPIVIPSITGSSAVNTLTIKPAVGVTKTITGSSTFPLIQSNGGSNLIIDGSNAVNGTTRDLTLTNTSTSSGRVVLIGSPSTTPVSNVVLKNTVINNGTNTTSAVIISSSSNAGSEGYFNNITVQNNSISNAYMGLFVNATQTANNGTGLKIIGNDLNTAGANSIRLVGIYIQGVDGLATVSNNNVGNFSNSNGESPIGIWIGTGTNRVTVNNNIIANIASTISGNFTAYGIFTNSGSTTISQNIFNNSISGISSLAAYVDGSTGIEINSATPNVSIYNNKIFNIKNNYSTGQGAAGVFLGGTSNVANTFVYNNMIWDVASIGNASSFANGHGIYVYSGAGYKIYYNSINLATNQTSGLSSALYVFSNTTVAGAIDLRNNIFANNQTLNSRYAIYSESPNTVFSNIDYNDFFSTGSVGYLGGVRATLADWRTATGKDQNSISLLPPFISTTDLHLSIPCAAATFTATPIAAVTMDIDGELRSASPTMGADDLLYIPATAASTLTVSASEIGCGVNPAAITLSTSGGSAGTGGVSTLFYEGNTCPVISYANEFLNSPSVDATTISSLVNGNRTFTATSGDPMIHLENVLTTAIDPTKIKFVVIRYKVLTNPGVDNSFQIYFKKNTLDLDEARVVGQDINTDGNWHIATIDMSTNAEWSNTGGDITGFRFDYASLSGTVMDIDYVLLGDTPILENTNANDISIAVSPLSSSASSQYGTFRISECTGQVVGCSTALNKTIFNNDRTFANNSNWSTASNWIQGVVPTSTNCVSIPSGKNVVVNIPDAAAKSITVADGGSLTIGANQTLTLQDALINNNTGTTAADKIVIASDGNLIQINANAANVGPITANREVVGLEFSTTAKDYVYWSSPVAGQITKGTASGAFSPGTANNRFYTYRESNDRFYETTDPTFVAAKGYAVQAESNQAIPVYTKTYTFKGTINNGQITIPVTRSADTTSGNPPVTSIHGYNMVGNPYPSNISFEVLYANNSSLIYNKAYFWTNATFNQYQGGSGYTGNNYAIYNGTGGNSSTGPANYPIPNGIVKVGQGFIIQKMNLGPAEDLKFTNTMRVGDGGTFYQKDAVAKNRFTLQLTSPDQLVNSQLIGYVAGATDGYEPDYDAEAFSLSSNLFYSTLNNDKRLLIQGRSSSFTTQDKVRLGANFFQSGNYTITLAKSEGIFESGQNIYLKDNLDNTVTNLSQGSYSFTSGAGENTGRFEIIYEPEIVLATDGNSKEELVVYKDSGDFVVKAQSKKITELQVFDMNGRLIYSLKPNAVKVTVPAAQLVNGTYLLKIDQNGFISTKKIIR